MDFFFCIIAFLSIIHGYKKRGFFYKFYNDLLHIDNCKKVLNSSTVLNRKNIFFIIFYIGVASQCNLNFPIYVNFVLTILFSLCTSFSIFNIFHNKPYHLERLLCLLFSFLSIYDISFIGLLGMFSVFFGKLKYYGEKTSRTTVDSEWLHELSIMLPNLFLCSGIVSIFTFGQYSISAEAVCYSILSIGSLYYLKAGLGKPHPKKKNSVWSLLPAAEIHWDWFTRYPYKILLPTLKYITKRFNAQALYLVYFTEVYYIFFAFSSESILLFSALGALLHIGIFILTGINFWKWTLINLFVLAVSISTELNCGIEGLVLTYFLYKYHYKNVIGLAWYDPHVSASNAVYLISDKDEKIRIHPKHLGGPCNSLELMQFNSKAQPIVKKANFHARNFGCLGITLDEEVYNKVKESKTKEEFINNFSKHSIFSANLRSKYKKIINAYIKHVSGECKSSKYKFFIWNYFVREPTHFWVGYKYKKIKNFKLKEIQLHHKFYLTSRDTTSNHILVDEFTEKL